MKNTKKIIERIIRLNVLRESTDHVKELIKNREYGDKILTKTQRKKLTNLYNRSESPTFWLISIWLGKKLAAEGEIVVQDFHGRALWCRYRHECPLEQDYNFKNIAAAELNQS